MIIPRRKSSVVYRGTTWTNNTGNDTTFLSRYIHLMKDQESAKVYDFMSALWMISSVIGRRVYVDRPRVPVYLNMYLIHVAESGITRKTTSVSSATNIIRKVISATKSDIRLIESRITPDALLTHMSRDSSTKGHTHIVFSISELAAAFGKSSHSAAMPALLTDVYDCPSERRGGGSVTRGEYNISMVYVSFISASTPSWLSRAVTPDIIEGGFTSRCLFIPATKPKASIAWPTEGNNVSEINDLVQQLVRIIHTCPNKITVNPAALDIFRNWYTSRKRSTDPFRASFEAREDAHILRTAALLSLSDESYLVNAHHIRAAIEIITWAKENAAELFVESARRVMPIVEGLATAIDRLRKLLIDANTIGVQQLAIFQHMRKHMSSLQLNVILEIMHELNMIQKFKMPTLNGAGRPMTLWRATKLIISEDMTRLLLERLVTVPERPATEVAVGIDGIQLDPKE